MNATTHLLRSVSIARLAAAATSAFAQAPVCTTSPGPDCLYMPASSHGFTPFERNVVYTDHAGSQRVVEVLIGQHDADAFHMLFELNAAACPQTNVDAAKCAETVRWLSSTAIAFLDGHVRQRPAALQWLRSDRIEQASGGVAEWQRK
jgi:prepilin-type processing-associated H-X9-DG protein